LLLLRDICDRKIKENEKLDVATRLAQQEEMERLQRLQDVQEQMLQQQAALDLRIYKQKSEILLPSGTSPVLSELLPAVQSDASVVSPNAVLPTLLCSSLATEGA